MQLSKKWLLFLFSLLVLPLQKNTTCVPYTVGLQEGGRRARLSSIELTIT